MSIQASPASSFEFKDLAYQVHSEMKQGTEIAPSIDELIARVESVRAWVDSGQLDREQKEIAVRWLDMVAARTQLSEDIRGRMLNLRTILMRQVLTPEQIEARVMREFQIDASNPKKFDEFIEAYITSRPLMTQEKAIMEFHRVWESMIAQQGYIVKVEQGFLIIYNKEGNLDRQRTASIAKLPDAVSIYQKQMTFLRAMQDTTSKSAKERAMSMVNLYNKQAGNKKIPPLTDRIIADEGSKNAYITEVSNSGLSEPDKAIVIHFLQNPTEAESVFIQTQRVAAEQNIHTTRAKEVLEQSTGVKYTKKDWDEYIRNPEKLAGDLIGGMGVWIAPATIYLILNLFGVGHDSLFMKLLAGGTMIGALKGMGVLNIAADGLKGQGPLADAAKGVKDIWDTSSKDGVVGWVSSKFGEATAATTTLLDRASAWFGYSNYVATYSGDGTPRDLDVVDIPFDYIRAHITDSTFDAKFKKDQSSLKSHGSEYSDFVRMVNELDTAGIKTHGKDNWPKVREKKTLAEVIIAAHDRNAAPIGERPAGAPNSGVVAGAAGAVAGAAGAVVDTARAGAGRVADVAGTAFEWLAGGTEQDIGGTKVRNTPKGLTLTGKTEGTKVTLNFNPPIKKGDAEVKELVIDDKTKKVSFDGFTLGNLGFNIIVDGGVITFMDAKKAAEDVSRAEADLAERTARETLLKKGEAQRARNTQKVESKIALVTVWNNLKESKDNAITVKDYLTFVNGQDFQLKVTLENVLDFIGPEKRSLNVTIPPKFNVNMLRKIVRIYITDSPELPAPGYKEALLKNAKNAPFAQKSLAEMFAA